MKVMLTCFAAPTHFYSLVPVAWALRTAGHEVRVVGPAELAETVTQAGLTAVAVERSGPTDADPRVYGLLGQAFPGSLDLVRDFDYTGQDPTAWTLPGLLELETVASSVMYATMNSDRLTDELVSYARQWQPDLVVWEMFTFAGAVAARVSGAAHARFVWGPDGALRARQEMLRLSRELPAAHRQDPTAEWLDGCLARYGGRFDEEIVTGQWTIDITPPSMRLDVGVHTTGVRYVPYNGPAVVPDWLRTPPRRPRVCLTLGLTSRTDGQPVDTLDEVLGSVSLGDLLDAVRGLDAEIVATVDPAAVAGVELPDNVRAVGFVPLNDLLPTCSVVLHQGGSGTRSTAEVHGVPQLMLTDPWDALRGQAVERVRAGLTLDRGALTADVLRDSLERLLKDPVFTEGAARVRREVLAEPSPNDLVARLTELTGAHRRRVPTLGGNHV
ncbi:activator-dependent family glycosyltransferase [Micromonospora sp. WMMD714]|uniref:activator-dependent family glycosyltransferase n=1 Tax=Micromonospora sp. WMMD714 TaxID=3016097 RepID=UPI00249A70FA|nr:activator-dependent family glycosyltransferase [Micromonospora sp. WMMD714]WFE63012.1 activator-dependent family glycosyltransferase [Micromonospora sp. WMMD714]